MSRQSIRQAYDGLIDVAQRIDAAWRQRDYDHEVFPQIVWDVTDGFDTSAFGNLSDLATLIDHPYVASLQIPSTFSDLYLTLFNNGRFWIEVLNWWGSDINPHDHNFTGVQFQLKGKSLNVIYGFSPEINLPNLAIGKLGVTRAEMWTEGFRSLVLPGAAEPHNVSHLDVPTVSMLIRTHPVALLGHQNNYLAPDMTGNYGIADIRFRKKVGALRLLGRSQPSEFQKTFRAFINDSPHVDSLFLMLKTMDFLFSPDNVHLLEEYAAHGALEQRMVNAVAYAKAQDFLTNVVKYTPCLTADDILAVSILASSFNQESFDTICHSLSGLGLHVNQESIAAVSAKLSPAHRAQFERIHELFGISLFESSDCAALAA